MFILKIVKTFTATFAAFTLFHLALSLMKSLQAATYKIVANENIQKAFSSTNVLVILSIAFAIYIIFSIISEVKEVLAQTEKTSDRTINDDIDESIQQDSSIFYLQKSNSIPIKDSAAPIDPGEPELASLKVVAMSQTIHSQKIKNPLFCYYSKWNVTVEGLERISYLKRSRSLFLRKINDKIQNKFDLFEEEQEEQLQFKLISCMILSPKTDKQSSLLIETSDSEGDEIKDIGNPIQSQALTLRCETFKSLSYLNDIKAQLNAYNLRKLEFLVMKASSKLTESLLRNIREAQFECKPMTVMKSRFIFNSKIRSFYPQQNNTLLLSQPEPSESEIDKSSTTEFRFSREQLRNILSIVVFFD